MGSLDGALGNTSECSIEQVIKEYGKIFAKNENVERAYKLIGNIFIFTNKRLILIDKQEVTDDKIEYLSIPYRSITRFSIETLDTFTLDAQLKIWLLGSAIPIEKKFDKSLDIYEVESILASYVLK